MHEEKYYTPSLVLQDGEQIGQRGNKDPMLMKTDKDYTKSEGLQPTYTVTGYQTEVLPQDNLDKLEVKQSAAPLSEDEQKKLEVQKFFERQKKAQQNYKEFLEQNRIEVNEDVDIKVPSIFLKYANEKHEKCYGRGITGWRHVTDNRPITKSKTRVLEPIPCRCVSSLIKDVTEKDNV